MHKIKMKILILYLLILPINLLVSNVSSMDNREIKSQASQHLHPDSDVVEKKLPEKLDAYMYDQYVDGSTANRGTTSNPLPRASSSQPISKDEFHFVNLDEFVIFAGPEFGDVKPVLYQDGLNTFQSAHIYSIEETPRLYMNNDPLEGYTSDVAMGDIDGDGYEETIIITSGGWCNLFVFDDAPHSYELLHNISITDPTCYYKALTTGDVDGDGIEEIVLLRSTLGWDSHFYLYLDVYDVFPVVSALTSIRRIARLDYDFIDNIYNTDLSTMEYMMEPAVATGDFDGDGKDEIACAYSSKGVLAAEDFWVIDDWQNSFANMTVPGNNLFPMDETGDVDIAAGDFDGDGKDEIVYTASAMIGSELVGRVKIIDNDFLVDSTLEIPASGPDWVYRTPVACGDLDGDGLDEIAVVRVYKATYPGDLFIFELIQNTGDYDLKSTLDRDFTDLGIAMGDVDCDGLDEIVCSGRHYMGVIDDFNHGYATLMTNLAAGGLVACGEADGDGIRMRYTGETWPSAEIISPVLVLAAPPTQYGINQNYASSYTQFGESEHIAGSEDSSFGVSSGTTFSFDHTISFGIFGLFSLDVTYSMSRTLQKEFACTNTVTHSFSQEVGFICGSEDDAIVYMGTEYTCYKYEIIQHPTNSSLVGTNMTIDIPSPPTLYKTDISYYNDNSFPTIGEETFNHTVGQPWTYPNSTKAPEIAPNQWHVGPQTVGQGSGSNYVAFSVSDEVSTGMSVTCSSEYAHGVSVAGTGWEESYGAFDSSGYTITTAEESGFEGSIGDIANQTIYDLLEYSYGLFVYYFTHPDGISYQVINYYVDDAVEYHPPAEPDPDPDPNPNFISMTAVIIPSIFGLTSIFLFKIKFGKKILHRQDQD